MAGREKESLLNKAIKLNADIGVQFGSNESEKHRFKNGKPQKTNNIILDIDTAIRKLKQN